MKKLLLLILALLLSLSACSPAQTEASTTPPVVPAPSASLVLSDSPSSSVYPTEASSNSPADSPIASPFVFAPDTNIPDVIDYPGEISICSSNPLQEDDNYYYFSPTFSYSESTGPNSIYCISKSDGSIKKIAENYGVFIVTDGIVYYTAGYPYNTVYSYDTASGATRKITTLEYGIEQLSYFNGRFYYSLNHSDKINPVDFCELYSSNKDWSDVKRIADTASPEMFFIYNNKIYYELSPSASSACIFVSLLDGSDARQISDAFQGWYEFEVKYGKLFYHDRPFQADGTDWTFNIKNISKGKVKHIEDFDSFALLGQYVVFPDNNNFLNAYNITDGKQYKLLEINEDYVISSYTTPCGAYISLDNLNGFIGLYKVIIAGGKVSLEKVAEFNGGNQ